MLSEWRQKASASRQRIALAEPTDPRNLLAGARSLDFCDVTLVCRDAAEKQKVEALAQEHKITAELAKMEVLVVSEHPKRQQLEASLVKKRAGKKVPDFNEPLNFANVLLMNGLVDGHVSGSVYSSGDVTRSAAQIIGTMPGVSNVSSFFVMDHASREETLIFADCAVMVNPNPQELAEIADMAAANRVALFPHQEARVALLSFSTKGSAAGPEVEKVTEALRRLKERNPSLKVDGELQLDAAIVKKTGESKAPGSPVAGKANVLVFPTLDAANIGYKLTQRLAGYTALGPIFQGLSKACNDLSRGCSSEDVEGTIIITALQAIASGTPKSRL